MTMQVILRWTYGNSPGQRRGRGVVLVFSPKLSGQSQRIFSCGPGGGLGRGISIFCFHNHDNDGNCRFYSSCVMNICAQWTLIWGCLNSPQSRVSSSLTDCYSNLCTFSVTVIVTFSTLQVLDFSAQIHFVVLLLLFYLRYCNLKMNKNCGKEWERFLDHSLWRQHSLLNKYTTTCPMLPFPCPVSTNHNKKMHFV